MPRIRTRQPGETNEEWVDRMRAAEGLPPLAATPDLFAMMPSPHTTPPGQSMGQPIALQTTPTGQSDDGGDIVFTAGLPGIAGPGQTEGRGGRIIWAIQDGPSIIMHGLDSENSFTIEDADGKVLLAIPKNILGKYSLEDMVREIVRREIRLATVAGIQQAVKQELGALKGYTDSAKQAVVDLDDMGLIDDNKQ